MAPKPSSECPGAPIFRTSATSSGAPSAFATSNATGTPPRGNASTTGCSALNAASAATSCRPAARIARRCDERAGGAGARAEIADRQRLEPRLPARPIRRGGGPRRQQLDVEHVGAAFLLGTQQVEQQGSEMSLPQPRRDLVVARRIASAAAAVGEDDEAFGAIRNSEQGIEPERRDADRFWLGLRLVHGLVPRSIPAAPTIKPEAASIVPLARNQV